MAVSGHSQKKQGRRTPNRDYVKKASLSTLKGIKRTPTPLSSFYPACLFAESEELLMVDFRCVLRFPCDDMYYLSYFTIESYLIWWCDQLPVDRIFENILNAHWKSRNGSFQSFVFTEKVITPIKWDICILYPEVSKNQLFIIISICYTNSMCDQLPVDNS